MRPCNAIACYTHVMCVMHNAHLPGIMCGMRQYAYLHLACPYYAHLSAYAPLTCRSGLVARAPLEWCGIASNALHVTRGTSSTYLPLPELKFLARASTRGPRRVFALCASTMLTCVTYRTACSCSGPTSNPRVLVCMFGQALTIRGTMPNDCGPRSLSWMGVRTKVLTCPSRTPGILFAIFSLAGLLLSRQRKRSKKKARRSCRYHFVIPLTRFIS